jgi:hypothetical protein
MSVEYNSRAGYIVQAEGTPADARLSRIGATIIGDGQGKYYEQASRGLIFSAGLTAWTSTVAAGNIIGAAAAASTQFAIWNPVNSGKNISILKFGVYPISGTAPIPAVFHSISKTAPTIATSVAATYGWFASNYAGGAVGSVAGVLASQGGAALTGSSVLTIVRAADLYITAGTAANLQGGKVVEYVDGDIVIPPGTCWVPTWAAAGTTFLGGYSVTWEEIPV